METEISTLKIITGAEIGSMATLMAQADRLLLSKILMILPTPLNILEILLKGNALATENSNGATTMNMKADLRRGNLMGKEHSSSREECMRASGQMERK